MTQQTKLRTRITALVGAFALLCAALPPTIATADVLTGSGATGKPTATIVSEVATTLADNLAAGATTATLTSGTGFASGDTVLIGNEVVTLTTVSGNSISAMTRATTLNSVASTAVAHRAGESVRKIAQTVQIVFEAGDYVVQSGDQIVVAVPDGFGNFSNLTASDVSTTLESTGSVSATETLDATGQTITLAVTGAFADANEALTINLGATNKLQMPARPGNYAFQIAIKNSAGAVVETGYALFGWANSVQVRATVAEALVLTIDSATVNLNVDPSVNNGEDYSQKTILTARTNANSGYKIQAKLAGAENPELAELDGTDAGNTSAIATGNAESTENRFGYIAYNSTEESKTKTELQAEATPAAFAAGTSANLALYDGTANGIGFSAPTNSQTHTIYYAFNVDYLTPAGTYEGTITYVALPTF